MHCMLPLLVSMGCCPGEQALEPLTQSFVEVEPECIVINPEGHCVQLAALPVEGLYVSAGQAMQTWPLPK